MHICLKSEKFRQNLTHSDNKGLIPSIKRPTVQFASFHSSFSLEFVKGNALGPHIHTISIAFMLEMSPSSFNTTITGSSPNPHSCLMKLTTAGCSDHGLLTESHGTRLEKNLKLVLADKLHPFVDGTGTHNTTQFSAFLVCCTRKYALSKGSRSGFVIRSRTILLFSSRMPICFHSDN